MEKAYSVKYTKKEKRSELLIDSITFNDNISFFGKEQQMEIEQLHLFQFTKKGSDDYNEDFFSGRYLTMEMFQRFLQTLTDYEIYSMAFEIENGIYFKIEDGAVAMSVNSANEKLIYKVLSMFASKNKRIDYDKFLANQGKYIYFKNTPDVQIISNDELWNKFETSVN